ncbi:hypothetical protein [Streptomyces niveiscabiei]|uniref:Uncharacterized protein n=1 Tax=Streptomyces niveiscabiei TaxID=164115 RepID=A0ABW9I5R5_9ACTN
MSTGFALLEDRICVSPPYYALESPRVVAPGRMHAGIPVGAPAGAQVLPLPVAEVGRHFAILGLCAAATLNPRPGRHYYLARRARIACAPPAEWPPFPDRFGAEATAEFTGVRRARAAVRAQGPSGGGTLVTAEVEYDVLAPRVFQRIAGPPAPAGANRDPYGCPLPLRDVVHGAWHATGELDVTPDLCVGHFDRHPVLPVAFACAGLSELVDRAVPDGQRWAARSLELMVPGMARAGERATLSVAGRRTPEGAVFTCAVRAGGAAVIDLVMEVVLVP